jgi:hypothetical protein
MAGVSAYLIYQVSDLKSRLSELESAVITVKVGATIDYGDNTSRTETVYLSKGSTALDAFRRFATIETVHYSGLGDLVVAIDGVRENAGASKYWQWYIWQENTASWELAPVGVGSYELNNGENIMFRYEVVSW